MVAHKFKFFLAMAKRKTAYRMRQITVMVNTTTGKRICRQSGVSGHLLELTKMIPLTKYTTCVWK